MACPIRKYPLNQPKNFEPPVPRWSLVLPESVSHIYTTYIGIQKHTTTPSATATYTQALHAFDFWLNDPSDGPSCTDAFTVVDGHDIPTSNVWVSYWTDHDSWTRSMARLNLSKIYTDLGTDRSSVGLWSESFSTPTSRLETNYSGLDHKPGLADLPDTSRVPHKLTAYWGAARDRIPASANDRFENIASESRPPTKIPAGLSERLIGTNYENMVHIRSGQFWENCNAQEREAYESTLEPTLMTGMAYLWDNPLKTGTLGLRFLRNVDPQRSSDKPMLETCGAGFFRNLDDLEQWAKRHPSHLAIFNGAHRHAKAFGDGRKFRTWHEVSVLKKGEVRFEYVNCKPETGVVRFVGLEREALEQ